MRKAMSCCFGSAARVPKGHISRQVLWVALLALCCSVVGAAVPASAVAPAASTAGLRCANTWKTAGYDVSTAVIATAVGLAESACSASATHANHATKGCPKGSVDRGMWQINSCYHPEVSATCAFDAVCNAQAAFRISNSGTNWRPWAAYVSGAYRNHLDDAKSAVATVYGDALTAP